LESSAILYQENQPMDPELWDSLFAPISLFDVNQYLNGDAKNITCSLLRIVVFIKQCSLSNKTIKDIPAISEFSTTVWFLISMIYKSKQE